MAALTSCILKLCAKQKDSDTRCTTICGVIAPDDEPDSSLEKPLPSSSPNLAASKKHLVAHDGFCVRLKPLTEKYAKTERIGAAAAWGERAKAPPPAPQNNFRTAGLAPVL